MIVVKDQKEQDFIANNEPQELDLSGLYALDTRTGTDCSKLPNDIPLLNCVSSKFNPFDTDFYAEIINSCNQFTSTINQSSINDIFNRCFEIAKEPMKSVWRARGKHHSFLLIDGLVKYRCLFRDYDPQFKAIEEDYKKAEKILIRMVESWDTDMSIKNNRWRGF